MSKFIDTFKLTADRIAFFNRGVGLNAPDLQSAVEQAYRRNNLDIINVKDHGVKGDGQTNDSPAVQALINQVVSQGGGVIYFPSGNYLFENGVTVSGSNIQLEFAKNAIILFESQTPNEAAITFSGSEGTTVNVTNDIEKGSTEIEVESIPPDLKIGDWILIRTDELFHDSRPYYWKSEYHIVKDIQGNTITVQSPTLFGYSTDGYTPTIEKPTLLENVGVSGARIEGNADVLQLGIRIRYCLGASVSGCYLNNIRHTGVSLSYSIFTRVIENYIHIPTDEDGLNYGVDVQHSQYLVVSNNTIISYRTAIDLGNMVNFAVVIGNSVEGRINSHSAAYVTFANNMVRNAHIYIRGPHTAVLGNKVYADPTLKVGIGTAEAATENIYIENNDIYFPEGSNELETVGIQHTIHNFQGLTVRGNKIFGAWKGINLRQGDDSTPGSNIIIEGNYIVLGSPAVSNEMGIDIGRTLNTIVKGNLIIKPSESDIGGVGIDAWANSETFANHVVDSNMVIGPFSTGVSMTNHYTKVIFTNNLIDGSTTPYNIAHTSAIVANNQPPQE